VRQPEVISSHYFCAFGEKAIKAKLLVGQTKLTEYVISEENGTAERDAFDWNPNGN
jgi:hypothetical protein